MIQAIDRAARVLSSLQGARHLGITELSAELGLPVSPVHGIVKSLQGHGLVAKEPGGSRYMLGPALLKLSNVYLDTLDVRARAMRWTLEPARRTGLSTRLGVPLFDEVIIIHHNQRPDGSQQSVAAPGVDSRGNVIAAVAVVVPSTEWPPESSVLNGLRETARNISRELGASTWPPQLPKPAVAATPES